MVPVCKSCGKKAWPPLMHCPLCFAETRLEPMGCDGVLEELATSHVSGHEGAFGIVKMDGFRVVGSLDGQLHKGEKVRMTECGVGPDGSPFYRFSASEMNTY